MPRSNDPNVAELHVMMLKKMRRQLYGMMQKYDASEPQDFTIIREFGELMIDITRTRGVLCEIFLIRPQFMYTEK